MGYHDDARDSRGAPVTNRVFLAHARRAVKALINESPESIIIQRQPMADDGFGGQVPDPFADPVTVNLKVRISHERSQPASLDSTSAGLSTNLQRFIMTDHKADIQAGDVFEALGRSWRVGPIDPLMKFGGVTGYQAPLMDAAETEAGT